ncbi:Pyridoxal phosphate-dependent transferase [Gracilaria domingensis]|nr:Pyridoxal phosphate-dependent transferase [Gracilaria domingensis]
MPSFDFKQDQVTLAEYYGSSFDRSGRVKSNAPKWLKTSQIMTSSFFPSPYNSQSDSFRSEVSNALAQLEEMKHKKGGPAYLGTDYELPDYSEVNQAEIPETASSLHEVVSDMLELFEGMINTAHPLSQPNVLPPANKAAIIATLFANYFSQNLIEGEYAWNLEKAEMETAAMVAKLIPNWDSEKAGGIFTFGGSGCYLYGVKYAMTHVMQKRNSRFHGVRVDGKILVSRQGHYAMMNATDWLGIGMENIVTVETDVETNAMDTTDLRKKLDELKQQKIPVLAVICTMGTTDAFAIDPVDEVHNILSNFKNPEGYERPLIYCDAVIGWSFLTFKDYDFGANVNDLSQFVRNQIERVYNRIQKIEYADAVGIDFHKTGFAPYATSLFLVKDLVHFKSLMSRPGSAYLNERTMYNPGLYTLEVSRSAAPALSAWATFRFFGMQGFQMTIANVLEMSLCLRAIIATEKSMVCVNNDDTGFVTLFRIYEEHEDAQERYERELNDDSPAGKALLAQGNKLQEDVANMMWWWLRSGSQIDGMYGAHITYTSGFRTTTYNDDMGDSSAVLYALKSYPLNVNITPATMRQMVALVKKCREMVLDGESSKLDTLPICRPYSDEVPDVGSGVVGSV